MGRETNGDERSSTLNWRDAADALADEAARVTALLRSIRDPGAAAVGQWNVGEVAMHLSQAWVVVPGLVDGDLRSAYEVMPPAAGVADGSLIDDVWDLGVVTTSGVEGDPERDPRVLADRIEERARVFLGGLDGRPIGKSHTWLVEGVRADLPMLICHLLNETIVHGWDIATAAGRPWPIPRSHAALVVEGFLFPVLDALGPRTMVDQVAAAGLRATFELHVRGGGRHLFTFDDGNLTIERRRTRKVDCHLSVDPAALLLVAWGRRSQWRAIARGQLLAWGRRPWLGPRFRSLVRNP